MTKEFIIAIIGILFIGVIAINMTLFMIEEMIHKYSKYKKKDTKKYRKNNTVVLTLARQSMLILNGEKTVIISINLLSKISSLRIVIRLLMEFMVIIQSF